MTPSSRPGMVEDWLDFVIVSIWVLVAVALLFTGIELWCCRTPQPPDDPEVSLPAMHADQSP